MSHPETQIVITTPEELIERSMDAGLRITAAPEMFSRASRQLYVAMHAAKRLEPVAMLRELRDLNKRAQALSACDVRETEDYEAEHIKAMHQDVQTTIRGSSLELGQYLIMLEMLTPEQTAKLNAIVKEALASDQ